MNKLNSIFRLSAILLLCTHSVGASEEKDYGITRQTHGSSEFTFRNERLVHELSKLGQHWSEVFYDGASPVFVRVGEFKDGAPIVTSERFTGLSNEIVRQVSTNGDLHPRRIYAGGEIYNRSGNGFFEIMVDPSQTFKESTLMGVEFATKEIYRLREKFLRKPTDDSAKQTGEKRGSGSVNNCQF